MGECEKEWEVSGYACIELGCKLNNSACYPLPFLLFAIFQSYFSNMFSSLTNPVVSIVALLQVYLCDLATKMPEPTATSKFEVWGKKFVAGLVGTFQQC